MKLLKKEILDQVLYTDRDKKIPLKFSPTQEEGTTLRFYLTKLLETSDEKHKWTPTDLSLIMRIINNLNEDGKDLILEEAEWNRIQQNIKKFAPRNIWITNVLFNLSDEVQEYRLDQHN